MDNARKDPKPQQVTSQPAVKKHVGKGVPGEESSKAGSKETDGRSKDDRDGNTEQARNPGQGR